MVTTPNESHDENTIRFLDRYTRAIMVIAVMVMAALAVMAWLPEIWLRIGPRKYSRSSMARMATLNRLLPKMFPKARSTAPIFSAALDTTTSGNEVDKATRMLPTNVRPSPVMLAISSATRGKYVAAPTMMAA